MLRSHSHEVLEVCTGEAGPSTGKAALSHCTAKPSSPAAARLAMRPKKGIVRPLQLAPAASWGTLVKSSSFQVTRCNSFYSPRSMRPMCLCTAAYWAPCRRG